MGLQWTVRTLRVARSPCLCGSCLRQRVMTTDGLQPALRYAAWDVSFAFRLRGWQAVPARPPYTCCDLRDSHNLLSGLVFLVGTGCACMPACTRIFVTAHSQFFGLLRVIPRTLCLLYGGVRCRLYAVLVAAASLYQRVSFPFFTTPLLAFTAIAIAGRRTRRTHHHCTLFRPALLVVRVGYVLHGSWVGSRWPFCTHTYPPPPTPPPPALPHPPTHPLAVRLRAVGFGFGLVRRYGLTRFLADVTVYHLPCTPALPVTAFCTRLFILPYLPLCCIPSFPAFAQAYLFSLPLHRFRTCRHSRRRMNVDKVRARSWLCHRTRTPSPRLVRWRDTLSRLPV